MPALPRALYVPDSDGFVPTALTRGPWDARHQHGGPPAALLARAIERAGQVARGRPARISFDILRPVPIEPLRVAARVLRPGRRVELVEATLTTAAAVEVMRATAWRIAGEQPKPLPAGAADTIAPPDAGTAGSFSFWRDEVAYHRALDWRLVEGNFDVAGPATAWARLETELVEGESPSPLERLLVMADAASGISAVLDWASWLFINVDLGLHLHRQPRGEWFAMAATTRAGPAGIGLCTASLHDLDGPLGISTQSLLIAPRGQHGQRSSRP